MGAGVIQNLIDFVTSGSRKCYQAWFIWQMTNLVVMSNFDWRLEVANSRGCGDRTYLICRVELFRIKSDDSFIGPGRLTIFLAWGFTPPPHSVFYYSSFGNWGKLLKARIFLFWRVGWCIMYKTCNRKARGGSGWVGGLASIIIRPLCFECQISKGTLSQASKFCVWRRLSQQNLCYDVRSTKCEWFHKFFLRPLTWYLYILLGQI